MKITKQRLKEIIKEELNYSQNEGMFDKLKAMVGFGHKYWDKHIPALERGYRSILASYGGEEGVTNNRSAVIKKAYDEMTEFFLDWANKAEKGTDTRDWWLTMSGKQDRKLKAIREKYQKLQADMLQAWVKGAENERDRAEAQRAYDRLVAQKEDDEKNRQEAELARRSAAAKKSKKDPTKDRPNRGLGLAYGDARSEKERYGESKITKSALKAIIAEELENSKNEGKWGDFASAMFGRAKAGLGFGNKYWDGSSGIEKKLKPMVDNFVDEYPDISRLSSRQLRQLIDDGLALTDDYIDGAKARIGDDAYYTMDKGQKERYQAQSERLSKIIRAALAIVNEKAQSEREQKAAQELARKARRKAEEEREANEKWRQEYYANKKDKKDPKDARPNAWMGSVDRKAKTFGYGANESKITKSTLKSIIVEELAKAKSK